MIVAPGRAKRCAWVLSDLLTRVNPLLMDSNPRIGSPLIAVKAGWTGPLGAMYWDMPLRALDKAFDAMSAPGTDDCWELAFDKQIAIKKAQVTIFVIEKLLILVEDMIFL